MRCSRRAAVAMLSVTAVAVSITGCGGGGGSGGGSGGSSNGLTVWSLENQPDRFAATKKIAAAFTQKTGINVKVVAIDEQQFPQLIATAAESGKMPDVMGALSLGDVRQIYQQKLINTDAAAKVISDLGAGTFSQTALNLSRDGNTQLEIPSDTWAQILVYRKDLFERAGLQPPTTYDALQRAAATLTKNGQYGITLATDASDTFTEQSFESLALGNNCQLVDSAGKVALGSPACAATFKLYGTLAREDSPKGTQSVDTTRASYFAGKAAMVLWSTFILDELAGLRNDALPTCAQCRGDKQWLAKHSGIVARVSGPNTAGSGGSFGEIGGWTISASAQAAPAQKFVEYMMSDGYLNWLGMAPEGKFPVRLGPTSGSNAYVQGWTKLKAGVDTKATLSSIYDASTMKQITDVAKNIDRWALPQGQGKILGPLTAQNTISKAVASLASASAQEVQQQAVQAVQQVASSVK